MRALLAAVVAVTGLTLAPQAGAQPTSAAAPAVVVPQRTPDRYRVTTGVKFSHPFDKKRRWVIQRHLYRIIRSVPAGESIRIATFAAGEPGLRRALLAASRRGVSVRIIGDSHLGDPNHPKFVEGWPALAAGLGSDKTKPSWTMLCESSCRGARGSGNNHTKFMLVSKVAGRGPVVVTGSGNMTTLAVTRQWNHVRTVVGDTDLYARLGTVFDQMAADTPVRPASLGFDTLVAGHHEIFPNPGMTRTSDPVAQRLRAVTCQVTDPAGVVQTTRVRVGMYAWYGDRGAWLATEVRRLWDRGCDVSVETAVISGGVQRTLLATSGRGPIPLKLVQVLDSTGAQSAYLHAKWVTINAPDNTKDTVISGSCNFSDLGTVSDEYTGIYVSSPDVAAYEADFNRIWTQPQAVLVNLRTARTLAVPIDPTVVEE